MATYALQIRDRVINLETARLRFQFWRNTVDEVLFADQPNISLSESPLVRELKQVGEAEFWCE